MTIRESLLKLIEVVADEAERNSAFRRRIEKVLVARQTDTLIAEDRVGKSKSPDRSVVDSARRGGRRALAVLDPLGLARQGEDVLRRELASLNVEQLKDIVAEYGMDPGKLVMKWKDTSRIIDRIVELSLARSTKGDAFRADKPPIAEAPRE
jgi:hypothetical protein